MERLFWWSLSDRTIAIASYIGVIMLFMAFGYYVGTNYQNIVVRLLGF